MNYVEVAKEKLRVKLGDIEEDLLDLYTLLVLVSMRRPHFELDDIHDAWSVWRTKTFRDHRSIVPFDRLEKRVQGMDKPYADAIRDTVRELLRSAHN